MTDSSQGQDVTLKAIKPILAEYIKSWGDFHKVKWTKNVYLLAFFMYPNILYMYFFHYMLCYNGHVVKAIEIACKMSCLCS